MITIEVTAGVAEFNRDLFIERSNSGIKRTKQEGKKFGNPSALSVRQQMVGAICWRSTHTRCHNRKEVLDESSNDHAIS